MRLPNKNIMMVIAPQDFCEHELAVARGLFEDEGASVIVASVRTGRVRGLQGGSAMVAHAFSWLDPNAFDALLVLGGPGAEIHLWPDQSLHALVGGASAANKIVGAISEAPVVLARAGLLAGRKAAVGTYAAARDELRRANVTLQADAVVREDNVITGAGETSAWADEVIRALAY